MNTIAFYVKAGKETGYGHIVRCLALADELAAWGCECVFYGNQMAIEKALAAGYKVRRVDVPLISMAHKNEADIELAKELVSEIGKSEKATLVVPEGMEFEYVGCEPEYCNVWIVDLEGGCPPELAAQLREKCKVLVVLNGVGYPDGDPGRLLADLVFYQGVTRRPYELDWAGFQGEWHEGPRWLVLRENFQTIRAAPGTHDPPRVVVACGGADPKDVTGKAVRALLGLDCFVHVIIGPANSGVMIVDVAETTGRNVKAIFNPPDMAGQLAWADVACVSYGMTAFECLALGLPTVALSVSPDHAASANLVAERSGGALMHLGEVGNVGDADIRAAVLGALGDAERMSGLARAFVDGKGAGRVADRIMERLRCAAF